MQALGGLRRPGLDLLVWLSVLFPPGSLGRQVLHQESYFLSKWVVPGHEALHGQGEGGPTSELRGAV